MTGDIKDYIKYCPNCQLAKNRTLKSAPELHSIPIPMCVFKQVGIYIFQMPVSNDGFKYVVVLVDYFSKWTEARALKDKRAISVTRFTFDCVCRHGCMNSYSTELHRLCGTNQRITSAYHPQANGLVERQSQVINKLIIKVCFLIDIFIIYNQVF